MSTDYDRMSHWYDSLLAEEYIAVQFERVPDEGLLDEPDGSVTDMAAQLDDAGFGSQGVM